MLHVRTGVEVARLQPFDVCGDPRQAMGFVIAHFAAHECRSSFDCMFGGNPTGLEILAQSIARACEDHSCPSSNRPIFAPMRGCYSLLPNDHEALGEWSGVEALIVKVLVAQRIAA